MTSIHTTSTRPRRGWRLLLAGVAVAGGVAAAAATSAPPASAAVPNELFANLFVEIDTDDQPQIDDFHSFFKIGVEQVNAVDPARVGKGVYRFKFLNVRAKNLQVHVTPVVLPNDVGPPPICALQYTSTTSKTTSIYVNCFDPVTGKRTPGRRFFLHASMSYVKSPSGPTDLVYLQTSSTGSHKPYTRFRSTNVADRPKVKALGKGAYTVTIPNAQWGLVDGNVVTTAISSSARWCNPTSWGSGGQLGTDLLIQVQCYKQGGVPASSRFSLTATRTSHLDYPALSQLEAGAQSVDLGAGNGPINPLAYRFNSAGGQNTASFNTMHQTTVVNFPGLALAQLQYRSVLTVAKGGPHRCAISWAPILSLWRSVGVACFDPAGNQVKQPVVVIDADLTWCPFC